MSVPSAKIALWAMYGALIEALVANQVPDQYDVALPVLALKQYIDLEAVQYLSLLAAYLWHGKIWSPMAKQLLVEALHYYRAEIYNWHSIPQWPMASRLATLSAFMQLLELASAYQLTSASQNCQAALAQALAQLRIDLNQWALGAPVDVDTQIKDVHTLIRKICK